MKNISNLIKKRKFLSIVILIVVLFVGYWVYGKVFPSSGQISYVVTNVKKGNIVSAVSGSGQVSASNQIDLKSKVSGDIVYLNTLANGTEVKKDTLIAQIDSKDAEISLESARIAYAKLVKPADLPTTLQTENTLNESILSNKKAYDDALNSIANTFSDIPSTFDGMHDIIYGNDAYLNDKDLRAISPIALNYKNIASLSYEKANRDYDNLFASYKNISRTSSTSTIESFISNTYVVTKEVSEAIKNTQNAVDYVRDQKDDGSGTTEATNTASWLSTINTDLANLLSAKTALSTTYQDILKKQADLVKLKTGPDDLDIASQKLNLQQAQNSYNNYFIRAPFDGVLARLSVKSTDTVSSGTVIGTIVSSQKIANITLNEVDVERVRVGQKAKLTFDAVEGLTLDGTVITVDLVGTVSQGVVYYNVEIANDTQDERVKSGMSVTATITVDTKENVLVVPNSAVKNQGRSSYVEVFPTPLTVTKGTVGTVSDILPVQKKVETGTSNDTLTEIISGLSEGEQVVVRTINTTTTSNTTSTAPSLFGTGTRINGGGGTPRLNNNGTNRN